MENQINADTGGHRQGGPGGSAGDTVGGGDVLVVIE